MSYRKVMSARTLIGDPVVDRNNDEIGRIEEIMVDTETGRVAYGVLSFGGLMNLEDKLFAVPWNALEVDEANRRFVLGLDRTQLEGAPGFDQDDWPDMDVEDWRQMITQFYQSARSAA